MTFDKSRLAVPGCGQGQTLALRRGLPLATLDKALAGACRAAGVHYRLRWEAMPHHRDQPRPKSWPDPAMLRLLVIVD